ncbi:hypothetical protein KIW84_024499 [Lathyrus oleraceus]|uniref:Uncharacterized protein n=1 Tax=Pisum sativum TaxID=3888 RepID=A0A9D4YFV6_PEA|nr:hypothetical protein KIW84_024499 [Pisum sativum]
MELTCPCGNGYLIRKGDGGCRFFEIITSIWQPPSSSTPPPQSLSPSSRSSQSPSSSQGARSNARKYELLVRSLQVERSSSEAYLELIKEFADCGLED